MGTHHESHRGAGEDRRASDALAFVGSVEEMVRRLHSGEQAPTMSVTGDDASGTVRCVVDVDGTLTRIDIDDGWWDTLGPGSVAEAVLQAMRFAKSKAAMTRLILDRYGWRVAPAPVNLGRLFAAEPSEPLPPYAAVGFPAALARKANRALVILDAAQRFARTSDPSLRRVVAGPRGMFRVHTAGPDVVGAEVDEGSLHRSDAATLAADALAALSTAASSAFHVRQVSGRDG